MLVGMYYNNHDVRVEEMAVPAILPGEILVKVIASGICGSDVMEWYRVKKAPIVLGHEISGEIVETGQGVTKFSVGDRVFVSHHVPCNTCKFCLEGNHTACDLLRSTNFDPGGFAQYLRVPAVNVDRGVFIVPDEMSHDEGAFIEPLACVLRSQMIAKNSPGHSVLVLGSGISGLLHVALAKALGAGRIIATDINETRLEAAAKFGADVIINAADNVPERLKEENEGRGADLVIISTGAYSAFEQALGCLERGATLMVFAPADPGVTLPVPVNEFWKNAITLRHSYGAGPEDIETAIKLLQFKRVDIAEMITDILPLKDIQEGFRLVAEADHSIKVIIHPNE